jgi:serine/threonine-protein phosphatase 2A activator
MDDGEDELSGEVLDLSQMTKHINEKSDMYTWSISPAYSMLHDMLGILNDAVKSRPRSFPRDVRPIITDLLALLDNVRVILNETPRLNEPQRFGNRAFRHFLTRIHNERVSLLSSITDHPDVQDYFVQSFGSWTRIDYGTGHEFNFLAFISSLAVLGLIEPDDCPAVVFDVFWSYWDLTLEIQQQYNQEAAGSHGAWGVDDYLALPYVFGSAQLIDHPEITPANVIDAEVARANRDEYVYCKWIDHVMNVKIGPFFEHSRTLWSLRNLPHFAKLNGGMLKMYVGEIMDRFVVVQHFRCGSLLKWELD